MRQDQAGQPSTERERLRPHIALTPAACGEVLRALRLGIEAFRRCGVSLPRGTWLDEAASWLERVSALNSVGETDEELRRTSAAVAWAVDLYHISTCLGDESFRSIAVELGKITRGRLLASGGVSGAKNFLSQFWVGALLAKSKLNPRILGYEAHGKAKPDFLVDFGDVTFAVEVKRPSNGDAAVRSVGDAGDQIRRYDRPGIIIIDATDCMSSDPWEVTREGASVRARVAQELDTLHDQLVRFVERYSRSNKFHQVTMLMTYARYWSYVTDNGPRRDAGMHLRGTAFSYRWSHQMTALTKGIQEGMMRGLEQLTGNPPQYRFF